MTAPDTGTTHYDLLVIGFGKAGKTIAMERGNAGDKVAIIEASPEMYGGTCINIACVPTKTLINTTNRNMDWGEAVDTRDELIAKLNATNLKLVHDAAVVVIDGIVRFTGQREVTVTGGDDELTLTAEKVVINTGATPNYPPIKGIDGPRVHNSTTIQHISPRPERLVIVGGGPIGMEFAGLFATQGSRVTVVASSEPFDGYDERIATEARSILENQGVEFLTDARATMLVDDPDHVTVTYSRDGSEHSLVADAVLLATGRRPATDGLNPQAAGVEVGERGEVVVDKQLRTTADNVWAVGDVHGGAQQTYLSYDDYRVLSSQFSGDGSYTTEGRRWPETTFITPPLLHVGLTEREAREQGKDVVVHAAKVADMPIVPRPKTLGHPEGVAQVIVDQSTDEILGATLLCVDSQELINTVHVAMRFGITASQLGEQIYTHPSTSEIFNQLLG